MSKDKKKWYKIYLLFLTLVTILVLSACSDSKASDKKEQSEQSKGKTTITIGIQGKVGVLYHAKNKKFFEDAFKDDYVEIKWAEFTSGPPQFEAIASGRLDFASTGGTPLIAAQSGGVDFRAIGVTSDGLKNYAVLAPKGSSIKSLKDLKGKKVAVAPGSGSSNFFYTALDRNGIDHKNVEIIPLQPDEARAAFENGSVDAWAVWEPYVTTAIFQIDAVPILTSEDLKILSPGFLVASTKFTEEHPEYTTKFLEVYEKARKDYVDNIETVSKELSAVQGVDSKIILEVNKKQAPVLLPTNEDFVKAQQDQADFLYSEGIIDKKINVTEVIDNQFVEEALK